MDTTVIIAILGFITTLVGGYYTFRSKLAELKQESKHESQTTVRAANELLFQQIQTELTRRDKRITELEQRLSYFEEQRAKRTEIIESEKTLNRKLSQDLEREQYKTENLEKELQGVKERIRSLEKENTILKRQVNGIETGLLGSTD
jgi:chromosome segregation ATPase